jgi:hypothetical protein
MNLSVHIPGQRYFLILFSYPTCSSDSFLFTVQNTCACKMPQWLTQGSETFREVNYCPEYYDWTKSVTYFQFQMPSLAVFFVIKIRLLVGLQWMPQIDWINLLSKTWGLRLSWLWKCRLCCSEFWRSVILQEFTDVSEKRIASIVRTGVKLKMESVLFSKSWKKNLYDYTTSQSRISQPMLCASWFTQ